MSARLDRLLRPRSIAVIGGREAERMIAQLARIGFAGEVWPVNPGRALMGEHRVHADVDALPGAPDAAFVAVNRERSVDVVAALAARGAGGAVCYASGFREADRDGARLQHALVAAAGSMPLIGPNCYGLINYADRALLWPDQYAGAPLQAGGRGVALISQSSNLIINVDGQQRGLPVAYVLTVGNQAQTGFADLAAAVLEDPRVSAIGIYAESLGDVARLEAVAKRARDLRKPVVMLKAGRSALARHAALSHTASLAGDDAAVDALLARLGIARVEGLEALVETLVLVHVHGALPGFEVASMSCSGGEAALVADCARATRLRFRPLDKAERERVAATLGPLVAVNNPLDYHTFIWGDAQRLRATFEAMLSCHFDLTMLLLDLPRRDRCDDADWWVSLNAFADAAGRGARRCAVVATLPENLPEAAARTLIARGIAPLVGLGQALAAVEAAATIGRAWSRARPAPAFRAVGSDGPVQTLDEHAAKQLLAAHGVAVPHGRRAETAAAAAARAVELGAPVAVKALGIAHKTETGAVCLGLEQAADVHAAAASLLERSGAVLVERMVPAPVAELLVGVRVAPGVGTVLMLASGGILTELVGDCVTLLLPCEEPDVRDALARLRVWRIVEGYRGGAPADAEAVVVAVMSVARFAEEYAGTLVELDVNPLIACRPGEGAWAADALLTLREN